MRGVKYGSEGRRIERCHKREQMAVKRVEKSEIGSEAGRRRGGERRGEKSGSG